MKYQRSTTWGCKDTGIRKSEFGANSFIHLFRVDEEILDQGWDEGEQPETRLPQEDGEQDNEDQESGRNSSTGLKL